MPARASDKPARPRKRKVDPSSLDSMMAEAKAIDRQTEESLAAVVRQPGRFADAPEADLGRRLQETRESMRLTQGDLAELTKGLDADEKGISRAVVSLYESGTNRPSPREIRLLCEALKVSPNYLIYGDEHPFDSASEFDRMGTNARHDPEGFAWMAYVMSIIHHNHYDAVMKLVLDLARGRNVKFDQGLQDKANTHLIACAEQLAKRLTERKKLNPDS